MRSSSPSPADMRSKAYSRGLILHGFVSAFDSRKAFSSSRDSSVKTSRALTCSFRRGISGSRARMSLSKASGRFTLSTGQRRIQQDQIVLEVARRKRKATRLETYRVCAIVQTGLLHKIGPLAGACSSRRGCGEGAFETRRKQQQQRKYGTDRLTCGLD